MIIGLVEANGQTEITVTSVDFQAPDLYNYYILKLTIGPKPLNNDTIIKSLKYPEQVQ